MTAVLEHHARAFLLLAKPSRRARPCLTSLHESVSVFPRRLATGFNVDRKKPYYVTSPIFYVNAGRSSLPSHGSASDHGFSSSCRALVHPRTDGHPEAMASPPRGSPGDHAHRHGRAWHENTEGSTKSRTRCEAVL